jgi:hypothetical protein
MGTDMREPHEEPHELEYARDDPRAHEPLGTKYAFIEFLNHLSIACSIGFFLLMLLVCTDRMGLLLGFYLGAPLCLGHVLIAGLPAWSYLAANRSHGQCTGSKLLILSLIPVLLILLGYLLVAVVPKHK